MRPFSFGFEEEEEEEVNSGQSRSRASTPEAGPSRPRADTPSSVVSFEGFDSDGDMQPAPDRASEEPADVPVKLKSKRNGEKRAFAGHIYITPKVLADEVTVSWRCRLKDKKCKACMHTDGMDGRVLRVFGDHNHLGSPVQVEVELFKGAVKRKAGETLENVQQILASELPTVPQVAQEQGPSRDALRHLVYRQRKKVLGAPRIPTTRADIDIPQEFAYYTSGGNREKFLLIDTGVGDENRILVFGRESIRQHMHNVHTLYIDGTFAVCPPLFAQLVVVVGRRGNLVQPLLHALLPNRKQESYERLLTLIRQEYPDLAPEAVCLDYEVALINAVCTAFSEARLLGCYFHLSQAVMRHLTGGLKALYENDIEFNLHVRMILSLPFVPRNKVLQYFNHLKAFADVRLEPVLTYFEETYLGKVTVVRKPGRGAAKPKTVRRQPRYSTGMWNLFERFQNQDDTTTNYVEGAHRRCQQHMNAVHPDIWRFIFAMHGVQRTFDFDFHQHTAGAAVRKHRCNILKRNEKIRRIMEEVDQRQPIEYLRGIASCLSAD